jgi:hypothetical protein
MPQTTDPKYAESFGYSLAMRVMQSDLYRHLDGQERAECDELIARGQGRAVPLVAEAPREPVAWVDPASLRALKRGSVEHISAVAKSDADESDIPLYAALPASLAPMPEEWLKEAMRLAEALGVTRAKVWNVGGGKVMIDEARAALLSHLRTAPRPTLSDEARGTDAQILKERELTISAVTGAISFGYDGVNRAPAGHWLEEFWNLGSTIRKTEEAMPQITPEMLTEAALPLWKDEPIPGKLTLLAGRLNALLAASASPQQPEQKTDSFHLAAPLESAVQGLDAADGAKGPDHG